MPKHMDLCWYFNRKLQYFDWNLGDFEESIYDFYQKSLSFDQNI